MFAIIRFLYNFWHIFSTTIRRIRNSWSQMAYSFKQFYIEIGVQHIGQFHPHYHHQYYVKGKTNFCQNYWICVIFRNFPISKVANAFSFSWELLSTIKRYTCMFEKIIFLINSTIVRYYFLLKINIIQYFCSYFFIRNIISDHITSNQIIFCNSIRIWLFLI